MATLRVCSITFGQRVGSMTRPILTAKSDHNGIHLTATQADNAMTKGQRRYRTADATLTSERIFYRRQHTAP